MVTDMVAKPATMEAVVGEVGSKAPAEVTEVWATAGAGAVAAGLEAAGGVGEEAEAAAGKEADSDLVAGAAEEVDLEVVGWVVEGWVGGAEEVTVEAGDLATAAPGAVVGRAAAALAVVG